MPVFFVVFLKKTILKSIIFAGKRQNHGNVTQMLLADLLDLISMFANHTCQTIDSFAMLQITNIYRLQLC